MQSQISPSMKRKLRDIHHQLTLIDVYLVAAADRGSPMDSDEITKLEKNLHREIERIYTILDPSHRR